MMEPETAKRWNRQMRTLANGADDVEGLGQVLAIQAELDRQVTLAVYRLREVDGLSWSDIARAMGTSRQNAEKMFKRALARLDAEAVPPVPVP